MSQYYIARIRYQNPLPPPPFPPKLLNIPTPIDPYTTPEYTSTLAQQQPPNIDIDAEGGMPLDLAIIPGLFEGDDSGLYGDPLSELHPADRALLKTPETATTPSRSHSHIAVPFLRRTEYIATEKHSTPTNTQNILRGTRRPSLQVAQQELDNVFEDPEAQTRMIEEMFKDVDTEWIGKEHPKKRGVKCVDSWELLPDRGRIGQAFLLMRFQDDHISNFTDDSAMEVGILEPKEVPDFGTEYVFSAFLPETPGTAEEIKEHLQSSSDETSPPFNYSHIRDYEGNLINPAIKSDYAVYFLDERVGNQRRGAYYLPISGKSNLKRRRTTKTPYVQTEKIDGIELTLRGQTEEEREVYDKAKKEFEEGGPKVQEEEVVNSPEDEDGLSDTDAIGEVDPNYVA